MSDGDAVHAAEARTYGFDDGAGLPVDRDRRAFRDALGRYPTGVAVVTVLCADGAPAGITVNSFASVSLDPPLILWSVETTATRAADFRAAEHFAVSILADAQEAAAREFAFGEGDRFAAVTHSAGLAGVPLIDGALTTLECRREAVHPGGDHAIIVGRVTRFSTRPGKPLVFHDGIFLGLR